jgi:hypothetical protein
MAMASVSKTDYLLWRACQKNAWLRIHKPDVCGPIPRAGVPGVACSPTSNGVRNSFMRSSVRRQNAPETDKIISVYTFRFRQRTLSCMRGRYPTQPRYVLSGGTGAARGRLSLLRGAAPVSSAGGIVKPLSYFVVVFELRPKKRISIKRCPQVAKSGDFTH